MPTARMFRTSLSSLLAASAILVAGCSGDNPVDNPGNTAHSVPKPGSTYTFKGHSVDSNNVKIPGTDQAIIWTVTDNNISHNGKTGLVKIVNGTKVGLLSYAANGDLVGTSGDAGSGVLGSMWVTYPFGSKTTFAYPTLDSVMVQGGEQSRVRFSGTVTYLGEEDVVVNGQTFRAQKVLDKYTQSTEKEGVPTVTVEAENTLWYSPKVGYFVKQKTVAATIFGTAGFRSRIVADLTDYSLK